MRKIKNKENFKQEKKQTGGKMNGKDLKELRKKRKKEKVNEKACKGERG